MDKLRNPEIEQCIDYADPQIAHNSANATAVVSDLCRVWS